MKKFKYKLIQYENGQGNTWWEACEDGFIFPEGMWALGSEESCMNDPTRFLTRELAEAAIQRHASQRRSWIANKKISIVISEKIEA